METNNSSLKIKKFLIALSILVIGASFGANIRNLLYASVIINSSMGTDTPVSAPPASNSAASFQSLVVTKWTDANGNLQIDNGERTGVAEIEKDTGNIETKGVINADGAITSGGTVSGTNITTAGRIAAGATLQAGVSVYGSGKTGISGYSNENNGFGVIGKAIGTNSVGVKGSANADKNIGYLGYYKSTNENYGVWGESNATNGVGVYGSGTTGLYGKSDLTNGTGVTGLVSQASGVGVYGNNSNTKATGYLATKTASGKGSSGVGVYGFGTGTSGVGVYGFGTGTSGIGVYGIGSYAAAVFGINETVKITDSNTALNGSLQVKGPITTSGSNGIGRFITFQEKSNNTNLEFSCHAGMTPVMCYGFDSNGNKFIPNTALDNNNKHYTLNQSASNHDHCKIVTTNNTTIAYLVCFDPTSTAVKAP